MDALTLRRMAMVASILLQPGAGTAWELTGYYKNLPTASEGLRDYESPDTSSSGWRVDDYQRLRLKLSGGGEHAFLEAHYEAVGAWGDAAQSGALPWTSGAGRPRVLDLEHTVTDENRFVLVHGLDRASLTLRGEHGKLTVGRQAVTWGVGLIWSPVNLFAAFSPTEIDRDEAVGVDVVRAQLFLPHGAALDIVAEPLDMRDTYSVRRDDSALAARLRSHLGEYDLAVSGGWVASDAVAAGEFSGYLADAGFRGELVYTRPGEPSDTAPYLRGVLSVDYGFALPLQPYLAAEYYYNGFGTTQPERYAQVAADPAVARLFTRGTAFGLARNYLGLIARLSPSALTSIQSVTILNADDGSTREFVSGSVSLLEDLDLIAGVNVGSGGSTSELGRGTLCYSYLKWFF